jgi:type VI secretion system protein ImpL
MRRILLSRWIISGIGTALLAVLAWVFGSFIPAMEGALPRAAVILVLALLWAAANWWLDHRRRARESALAKGVAEADPAAAASAEESAAMRERLAHALELLRRARDTRGWLYEQLWYVVIGPPGAGKTTALLNSGLRFPLANEMGGGAVAGVGGTRLCDWWFTDDAVLIDTAGRYTTQDSDAVVDRAGWETFLQLLKRTRPRQPLNGAIVAIALADIAQAPREERLAHAAAVRRRLNELRDRLGVRLPVYALFTKADLIAGFSEFFDDLDREKRAQVWGTTFPLQQPSAGPLSSFDAAFRQLVERLDARMLDRMQAERSPDRRALIAGFPSQVASLQAPLQEFLDAAFAGSRLDPAPQLRGFYFASGTQEGTPIDRLTGALARSFGIDQRRAPTLRPEYGRGYFLSRLLRQVMLGEAMLVAEAPEVRRRRTMMQIGGYAAVLVASLGAGGWLWHADASNKAAIKNLSAVMDDYRQAAARFPLDPVADGNLASILPLLDKARALPFGSENASGGGGAGLSQAAKLAVASQTVYRNALQRVLLPRLMWRLEAQMRAALDQPDFLYQATRIYLMLGGQGPLDRDLVSVWMKLDWERAYPGPDNAAVRADLARHLNALLAQPLPQIALDGGLVDEARATFSRVPVAERVYSRIELSGAAQALPPWRPSDALGAAGAELFQRGSGKPLTDGIPGLFTPQGFHSVLLPSVSAVAKQVAAESWVLGKQSEIDTSAAALQILEDAVVKLYEADYARQWDATLGDLDLVPFRSPQNAAQALYVLGSPQSPMRTLLTSVAQELTLSAPSPAQTATTAPSAVQKAAAAVPAGAASATAELQHLLGVPAAAMMLPDGHEIDNRYQALRDYVRPGSGAPIDLALAAINALQQNLAQLAAAPAGTSAPASSPDPVLTLRAVASQAPMPVQRWLLSLAAGGAVVRAGDMRQQAAAAFNGADGPAQLCRGAVEGRYPFVRSATTDTPLEDFARLFAPGGQIDAFFTSQLKSFVNTATRVWKVQDSNGNPAPVSAADVVQFQRAAMIRRMFFAPGATTPSLRLEITPTELDPGAKQVTLDLGGSTISYTHGPLQAVQVNWPAQGGATARLVFDPPTPEGAMEASGPWALFRLLGQGELLSDGSPDRFTLVFQQGARRAAFTVRTSSVVNPFSAAAVLDEFRCPALR